jgi:catechol 2,3-dioxygenase-like lactoylglutathione lyase family enzyme
VFGPEGVKIRFTDRATSFAPRPPGAPELRIIHAGFIVKDRAAADEFFQTVLGFRLYWHGGKKDDQIDWVDMPVPDGADWVEYMLNVPEDADQKLLGVKNHFAIGVSDIEAANYRAEKHGIQVTEQPEIGRDGKWPLNLYDPDQTRVEFIGLKPAENPCCSGFTGPHPGRIP